LGHKITGYHDHIRDDVLTLIPNSAKTILSIGCGAGMTEAQLVNRGCQVTGIELDETAAKRAQKNGLKVINQTAEQGLSQLSGSRFECIILADILEHLYYPKQILNECRDLLTENGLIVISVPNFRHYSVFKHLFIKGHAPDMEAGILDKTHIHITTMKKLEVWLAEENFLIERKVWKLNRKLEKLLSFFSARLLDDFLAPQVLVTAFIDSSATNNYQTLKQPNPSS